MLARTSAASMWNLSRSSRCHCSARCGGHEDGEPLRPRPVEELAGDEAGLDGLADADVVGDQQADGVLAQRHEQRHELVAARGSTAMPAEAIGTGRRRRGTRAGARCAAGAAEAVSPRSAAVGGGEGGGARRPRRRGRRRRSRRRPPPSGRRTQELGRRRPGRTTHSRPRARTRVPARSGRGSRCVIRWCSFRGRRRYGYWSATAAQSSSCRNAITRQPASSSALAARGRRAAGVSGSRGRGRR